MLDLVYQTPVWEVADLRQRLINTWSDLSQSIVDDAVDEWHTRVESWMKKDILNTSCNILG